jgi:hypothetical protein
MAGARAAVRFPLGLASDVAPQAQSATSKSGARLRALGPPHNGDGEAGLVEGRPGADGEDGFEGKSY